MGRAPCCDKANVKRGPWSAEEDTKLKQFIERYGIGGNWITLPHKAGLKRCGKSCRLRWLNYLRPDIKHGEFSDDEDRIICSLYATIGSRWSIIAAQLPGRTDNDIKNYWNTKLKKKLLGINSQRKSTATANHHQQQHQSQYQQPQLLSGLDSSCLPTVATPSQDLFISSFLNNQYDQMSFGRVERSCSSSDLIFESYLYGELGQAPPLEHSYEEIKNLINTSTNNVAGADAYCTSHDDHCRT
ncbi:uncharacterized protein A4U43_C10F15620 [Asparagus officinalis]|uniref:Uncharacterized protein n=1 Tax=Asparagus officinalis TaxID=4686 RepID=A0A5P1E3F9_ASPOF|nr:transcription factor RAX3 [Asparagus officinalis]ONK57009.1 uncharacterized protein A4U43_C10F15620 [Asparagus officinalis]